jgi:hypothetical protein
MHWDAQYLIVNVRVDGDYISMILLEPVNVVSY